MLLAAARASGGKRSLKSGMGGVGARAHGVRNRRRRGEPDGRGLVRRGRWRSCGAPGLRGAAEPSAAALARALVALRTRRPDAGSTTPERPAQVGRANPLAVTAPATCT